MAADKKKKKGKPSQPPSVQGSDEDGMIVAPEVDAAVPPPLGSATVDPDPNDVEAPQPKHRYSTRAANVDRHPGKDVGLHWKESKRVLNVALVRVHGFGPEVRV
ncbi:hypothetical protein GSI_01454 [Ganoderma sinense ZZ0214-1]|uniref:Uncharacterized protein n=1 Tax=Ganoderma sinense ZZ0214-1 TaxID=1077348 RepID=A0A2G8SVH9_9APHY|nr:hypothetical protein GSI_01454 [Ganoderma sinense ZZ0214-1]